MYVYFYVSNSKKNEKKMNNPEAVDLWEITRMG